MLYPAGDCIFQDDEAKIHRTDHVLNKAAVLFKHRVPPGMASHTADLYPIENLWSILKDEVAKKAPVKDIGHLKRIIAKKWMELNNDKVFLKKMISSVPARVEAMVKLEGAQVHKSDYQKISGAGDS